MSSRATILSRWTMLAGILILVSVTVSGQAKHRIQGRVVVEGNKPPDGNVEIVVETPTGTQLGNTMTDDQGRYSVLFTTSATINVIYGNAIYPTETIKNLSGQTDHQLTKVLGRSKGRPSRIPDQGYDAQGSLEDIRTDPKNLAGDILALHSKSGRSALPTKPDYLVQANKPLRLRLLGENASDAAEDGKPGLARVAYDPNNTWVDAQALLVNDEH